MSKKKRRKFTPGEKLAIVKRHLVEGAAISDLCDEYGLNPTVFYRWQRELFEGGSAVFEKKAEGPKRHLERKVDALEAKLRKKDEVIAEIMADLIAEKKRHGAI